MRMSTKELRLDQSLGSVPLTPGWLVTEKSVKPGKLRSTDAGGSVPCRPATSLQEHNRMPVMTLFLPAAPPLHAT